ncbi:uncharacterized protein LOC144917761 [Branchiostoma floridae x Branchiostoma belcheri]
MADPDHLLEAEALENLGDVNLEMGKLAKDGERFHRAMMLYAASLTRCEDQDVGTTKSIAHRIQYKLQRCRESTAHAKPDRTVKTAVSKPAEMAARLQDVDFGRDLNSVLVGYTRLVVEGIVTENTALEVEAIKSLGDVFLQRGRDLKKTIDLTKAAALYNTALKRWGGFQGAVLLHRLLFLAKIREDMEKTIPKQVRTSYFVKTC